MMQVVFHDMPDNPAAGEGTCASIALARDFLSQIGERVAGKRLLHHLPGCPQTSDQFTGSFRCARAMPALVRLEVFAVRIQYPAKPARSRANDMSRQLVYRAQVRRGA